MNFKPDLKLQPWKDSTKGSTMEALGFCYHCSKIPPVGGRKKNKPLKRLARLEPGFAAAGMCVDCAALPRTDEECEAYVRKHCPEAAGAVAAEQD